MIQVNDLWVCGDTANGEEIDDWQTDFTYDNNGNLLSSSKNSALNCYGYVGNQKNYTYDVWGRLTSYSDSLGDSAEYTYYPDGLRRSKTLNGNTYQYYYNGDYVVNETKNGNEFATNVYGVDGPISRQFCGQETYFYKNVHGDVIFGFSSGKFRTHEYSYEAFGEEDTSYDYFSDPNPIRYSGEYFDTESGMTYLRARYYDPYQRRFISEDPHWNIDNMIYGDEQEQEIVTNTLFIKSIIQSNNTLFLEMCYLAKINQFKFVKEKNIYEQEKSIAYIKEKNSYDNIIEDLINESYSKYIKTKSIAFQDFCMSHYVIKKPNVKAIFQSNNLYLYCGNNPVVFIDPSGEGWKEIGKSTINGTVTGVISGAVGGAISGGVSTLGTLTVPTVVAGGIAGGITGAVGGFVQGILDEIW